MLTKILTHLALPPGCCLVLLGLALLLRLFKLRKTAWVFAVLGTAALALFSNPKFADSLVRDLESHHPPVRAELQQKADAIVVLGGIFSAAREPRLQPDISGAVDRLVHAAKLYHNKKAPKILASGGDVPWSLASKPESASMAGLLADLGVSKDDIWMEKRSKDTHENVKETAAFLKDHGVKTILLVTSAMHMPRVLATFRTTELKVIPAPTDIQIDDKPATIMDWLPSASAMARSSYAIKEHLGLLWYRLNGWAE